MRNFLAHVERRRYDEHEAAILATPGEALPREKPRASSGLTRKQVIAAKQRQYTSTYREAREAAKAGDTSRVQVLLRALPPTYQRELVAWCARNGVGRPS